MKIKYFHVILAGLMMIPLINFFFIDVQPGRAQSSQTWTDPINLSNAGLSTNPQLIIGAEDTMHVVWVDEFDGYKYVKSTGGMEWTSPITVRFPFSVEDGSQPVFITDPSGAVYAFWRDALNTLYYSRNFSSADLSTGWSNGSKLANSVVDFEAVVSPQGLVHIGYVSNLTANNISAGVYYIQLGRSSRSSPINIYSSQYFRSLLPEDTDIVDLTVSTTNETETVYVVWNDRLQKKIFLSKSIDQGQNWSESYELVGPEQSLGNESPHTAKIEAVGNGLLLTWHTGTSGVRCAYSSRWSEEGDQAWGESINLLNELGVCPERIDFGHVSDGFSLSLLKMQDNLAVIAWNGRQWSQLQTQQGLSALVNPINRDPILLGCQHAVVQANMLYVVGCDLGSSKDIWFTSRALGTVESWFPPPSAWSSPQDIARVSQKISSISSVLDKDNIIHLVWAQSPFSEDERIDPVIYYATQDGRVWSKPAPIITNLSGLPLGISFSNDNQGRLLLSWVDEINGELLFTWASANRARLPLEWETLSVLPVPPNLVSSPYLLADGAGTIVISYAIPFNEARGIYLSRSDDRGENWSGEFQVFDAISADWDSSNNPKMFLSGEGTLHILFSQYSLVGEIRNDGLYYSQSANGGNTWNEPTLVSDGSVIWYSLHAIEDGSLHILWQEKEGDAVTNYHRSSQDLGESWNEPNEISSTEELVLTDSVLDANGQIHFLQLTASQNLTIHEWLWNGSRWQLQESQDILVNLEEDIPTLFSAEITRDGSLQVVTVLEVTGEEEQKESRLFSFGRMVDVTGSNPTVDLPILSQPVSGISVTSIPDLQSTPTLGPLLPEVNTSSPLTSRNILTFTLVVATLIVVVIIFRSGRSRK